MLVFKRKYTLSFVVKSDILEIRMISHLLSLSCSPDFWPSCCIACRYLASCRADSDMLIVSSANSISSKLSWIMIPVVAAPFPSMFGPLRWENIPLNPTDSMLKETGSKRHRRCRQEQGR